MPVIYEVNPPRFGGGRGARELLESMLRRVRGAIDAADGVHVTDSVLGSRRVPALEACAAIRAELPGKPITMSVRTRDHDMASIEAIAAEARRVADGILLVMGDPPQDGPSAAAGPAPSEAAARLRESGAGGLRILLSVPAEPDYTRMKKKIAARPDGFVTQVISSAAQAERIAGRLAPMGFSVTPCVMLPSPRNERSARALGLDWSAYEGDAAAFVAEVRDAAGSVLVTSPSDTALAESVMRSVSTMRPGGARRSQQ